MTTKTHQVVDLGQWLHQSDQDAVVDGVAVLAGGRPGSLGRWEMLSLSPNARWSAPDPTHEQTVLVLEGVATFHVDDWRYSAAAGHLIVAVSGAALSAVNDGTKVMRALVGTVSKSMA